MALASHHCSAEGTKKKKKEENGDTSMLSFVCPVGLQVVGHTREGTSRMSAMMRVARELERTTGAEAVRKRRADLFKTPSPSSSSSSSSFSSSHT